MPIFISVFSICAAEASTIFISVFESCVDLELKDLEIRMDNCRKERQKGREEGREAERERKRKKGRKEERKEEREKQVGQAEWACCRHIVRDVCALPHPGTSQLPSANLGPSTPSFVVKPEQ